MTRPWPEMDLGNCLSHYPVWRTSTLLRTWPGWSVTPAPVWAWRRLFLEGQSGSIISSLLIAGLLGWFVASTKYCSLNRLWLLSARANRIMVSHIKKSWIFMNLVMTCHVLSFYSGPTTLLLYILHLVLTDTWFLVCPEYWSRRLASTTCCGGCKSNWPLLTLLFTHFGGT